MTKFSERLGITPRKEIQLEYTDKELRNSLWNVFYKYHKPNKIEFGFSDSNYRKFIFKLWSDCFKRTVDELRGNTSTNWITQEIKEYFIEYSWYWSYDILEFTAEEQNETEFIEECNTILAREISGYRFIGKVIAPIISEIEIKSIEDALDQSDEFKLVTTQLEKALVLLSDKQNPNYGDSCKNSISAVETMCKIIAREKCNTLSDALTKIEKKGIIKIAPALRQGFDNIYGYTSSSDGIRHGPTEEPNLDIEDSLFMLVACSAFINYLKSKYAKSKQGTSK